MRAIVWCLILFVLVISALVVLHDEPAEPDPPTTVVHVIDPRGDVEWMTPTTTTTTMPSPSTDAPTPMARTAPTGVPDATWDAVAACESGQRWDDTRGGYEGGLHFMHSTWVRAGGRQFAEHAYQATRRQQISIANAWLRLTDWRQWPACSRKLGLR